MVHAHGAIWKEEILKLLEVVKQPEKVAIMHCQGHQKGNTDFEIGIDWQRLSGQLK